MLAIFLDYVKHIMEVFMDEFSVYGGTFDLCLDNLTKVLHRCEKGSFGPKLEKVPFHGTRGCSFGSCGVTKGY